MSCLLRRRSIDHHTFYLLAQLSPEPLIDADFDADGDVDGDVDGGDFLALQRGYGLESLAEPGEGDADGNGAVNVFDFLAWKDQYGTPPLALATVPEPSVWATLLLAGMVASGLQRSLLGGKLRPSPQRVETDF